MQRFDGERHSLICAILARHRASCCSPERHRVSHTRRLVLTSNLTLFEARQSASQSASRQVGDSTPMFRPNVRCFQRYPLMRIVIDTHLLQLDIFHDLVQTDIVEASDQLPGFLGHLLHADNAVVVVGFAEVRQMRR